jgi:DHA3 family tetracycline resistance protein-like MFS transporter
LFRSLPAYPVYLAIGIIGSFFFTVYGTVSSVYRIETAGLNPFELVLVGTVLELGVFLFEVPTGVVADTISRRLSIIIGYAVMGLGFILEGSFPLLGTILAAQAIWGIGYTFTSGAEQAWIADELGEQGIGRVYLRANQMWQVGALAGAVVSVALASIALNVALLVGGAGMLLLALGLVVVMPERHFTRTASADRSTFHAMRDTATEGLRTVRGTPVLVTIIAIAAIFGAASEGVDRLYSAHLLENFTFPQVGDFEPVVWFGVISVVSMLLSLTVTEVVRRRVNTDSHIAAAKALLVINVLMVCGVLGFALAGSFYVALLFLWGYQLMRELNHPLTAAWINQSLTPRIRATVISMQGQADAAGQILGGPVLGAVATLFSIRVTLVAVAVLLTPALALYLRTLRRGALIEPLESVPAAPAVVGDRFTE